MAPQAAAAAVLLVAAALAPPVAAAPPRVIFHVLVDDLGWSDVGFHRDAGELETPTPKLVDLVAEGIHLRRHYVHYSCTPSRSALMSGRLPVHVQFTLDNPEVPSSGMPRNMTALANKLSAAGYDCAVVGKWDLGMSTPTHTPAGRGFNRR